MAQKKIEKEKLEIIVNRQRPLETWYIINIHLKTQIPMLQ